MCNKVFTTIPDYKPEDVKTSTEPAHNGDCGLQVKYIIKDDKIYVLEMEEI